MKYSFLLCLLALLLWNCGDDEGNLSPSGLEKNWFVLEDSEDTTDTSISQVRQREVDEAIFSAKW